MVSTIHRFKKKEMQQLLIKNWVKSVSVYKETCINLVKSLAAIRDFYFLTIDFDSAKLKKWKDLGFSALLFFLSDILLQASKVLNLCCKASWLCIKCHCTNLSEGALKEFVMEACTRSALLLDIMYDINNAKINKKVIEILKNWFNANDLSEKLPAPVPVVKQWVKVTF